MRGKKKTKKKGVKKKPGQKRGTQPKAAGRSRIGGTGFVVFRIAGGKFEWLHRLTRRPSSSRRGFTWGSRIGAMTAPRARAYDLAKSAEQNEHGAYQYGAAAAAVKVNAIRRQLLGK